MSYLIKKEMKFDAAHRLLDYKGKCRDLHGHTYKVVVELLCKKLDKQSIAVDFSIVKALFSGWIDENWDHNTILNENDSLIGLLKIDPSNRIPFMMKGNPTAEVMAEFLCRKFSEILFESQIEAVVINSVEVFETATSSCKVGL
jgi:6-pyruvoyltetrahydropterin/6-carboxytetrahydropterin synthase